MELTDYFNACGIRRKSVRDSTLEQQLTERIVLPDLYYDMFYQHDVDHLIDCVDYDLNLKVFPALQNEAKKYVDIFEPCCRSGILGCYLAANRSGYQGMDVNPLAIGKAKERARKNGLDKSIFQESDVLTYGGEHEAVIGRYVAHNWDYTIDTEMVEALARISPNIILVQASHPAVLPHALRQYKDEFSFHGYTMEFPLELGVNPRSGERVFMVAAHR